MRMKKIKNPIIMRIRQKRKKKNQSIKMRKTKLKES